MLIPKKQPGKFRPLGIPCIRDRVAQAWPMLVPTRIFEADLQAEQYAYREGCSAQDAVCYVHRLVNPGHQEIVDGDLIDYFREIPHAELTRSIARRVSDGRILGKPIRTCGMTAWYLKKPTQLRIPSGVLGESDSGGGTKAV